MTDPRARSAAIGSDAKGSNAAGSAAAGSDAIGSDAIGSDAIGSDAIGSNATGSNATGSDATGSNATGSGVTASGVTASGLTATGLTATGVTASGDFTASGVTAPAFGSGVPPMVDAFEFARRGRVLAGAFDVELLERLVEGLPVQPESDLPKAPGMPGAPGVVVYRVRGLIGKDGKSYLSLLVQTRLVLDCQRCLGPLVLPVDHEAEFELVRNDSDLDAGATELDAEDFDRPEKVVGSPRFDLAGLIEDELILEVPFIPRHEQCPGAGGEPLGPQGDEPAERESAFAALAALKSKHK